MSLHGFSVRRSESSDAEQISALLQKNQCPVFGRVNILHLLEKANLCVSLVSDLDVVLAHASFLDHPIEGLVDQREWEELVRCISGTSRYTPQNSLFLHLFVSEASITAEASVEIIRAVFRAVPELQFILLLSPHLHKLDQVLEQIFEPLQLDSDPKCVAQVCGREQHWPQLSIRPARVEDHDDVMQIFSEQTTLQTIVDKPFFLSELIEDHGELKHSAVCEINGAAVGFISVTATINVKNLLRLYDLSQCEGVFPQHSGQSEEGTLQTDQSERKEEPGPAPTAQMEPLSHAHKAFSVQLFTIHKDYESRSVDFLPYLFKLFPDRDLCLVTVPTMVPELPLVHNFSRISPRDPAGPVHELYALHRIVLRPVMVRRALPSDRPLVVDLVRGLDHGDLLLQDLDQFYQTETDQDCVALQSFLVQVGPQVLGAVVLRDEQEVDFLRAHYHVEDFIYFSLHSYQQHAALCHFVLHWSLRHCRHLVFREVLRLSTKTCLYHRVYPRHLHMSCCVDLDLLLDCAVPVRPRPQIDFPLDELGQNAPSNQITDAQCLSRRVGGQTPFSLFLVSRKLTLEQKVVVNARITVCGASETGLSLIQTLCCSPHLRFNNLTLVSTYGYHGDNEDLQFLSTSHALSHTKGALFPLSSLKTIHGSVVAIDRKCKHVQVCSDRKSSAAPSGDWLRYDLLLLCSGLQYQVPSVIGSDPVPLKLWTLENPEDRKEVQHWVQDNLRPGLDQGPEQRPDHDQDLGPEQRPDQIQDQGPDKRPDQNQDQGPEQRPDHDQDQGPDHDQDQGPEQRPDQIQDQGPDKRPDQNQDQGPEQRPDHDQDQGPDHDQDQGPEQRPDQIQDQGPEQRPDQNKDQGPEQRSQKSTDQNLEHGPDQRTERRPEEKDIKRDQDQDPDQGVDQDLEQDRALRLDERPDQDPDQKPAQGPDRRADQRETQGHMVVFGHNIDAFTTVQALLSLGLPGPQIHLVLAPSESVPWLLDPVVDQAVIRSLERVQVQVYKDCELQTIRTQENRVTGATFSCRGETIEICCGALVCLCSPGLDHRMLRAILNSFLVFDGRLVVDRCFHTSDPWIYAAGTMTKYCRKYYSEDWGHQRYCSTQIGQDFARQILLLFDPTSEPREESELLPLYHRPKITGGFLPGELHFLHVTKPSKLNSVPYLKESALVSGDPDSGSYFRLQLDDCERVETITCASHKPLPLHNLLCLYGQPQSLLGNLSARFCRGQVTDLYSFFRQSWCLAIFHDRFTEFQLELRALANHSATETDGEEQRPSEDLDPETRTEIRSAVVRYLSYNRNLLPMFALPGNL